MNFLYVMGSARRKQGMLVSYAVQDPFFARILDDMTDFGYRLRFSWRDGTGVYGPFALRTEKLDTPEKIEQFSAGFHGLMEEGTLFAKIGLPAFAGQDVHAHLFLHEMVHFYQDMCGLYFVPLQEEGVFPVCLDAKSDIVAILFCEAWAAVEAIRTSWALREKGDDLGWRGAMFLPDWKGLAQGYDTDLQGGMDEKRAAARLFEGWYKGAHRSFYERHALKIHEMNFMRYRRGVVIEDSDIVPFLRTLDVPVLLDRISAKDRPSYFDCINFGDKCYTHVQTLRVKAQVEKLEERYGKIENSNIQDIKCGAPPYLWRRLRLEAHIKQASP